MALDVESLKENAGGRIFPEQWFKCETGMAQAIGTVQGGIGQDNGALLGIIDAS